jgi:WD40 repeat protein
MTDKEGPTAQPDGGQQPGPATWQFSLTQLLMAITLVSILMALVRSEGCGRRYSMASSLDFSPDGKRLVVARYDARDANVPLKGYKADASRTISIVDVESASVVDIVEHVLEPGNRGPAFGLYWPGRQSVVFGADADTVFLQDFRGTKVTPYVLSTRQCRQPLIDDSQFVLHLAISPDRMLLAMGHAPGVVLCDTRSGTEHLRITTDDMPFLGSPLMAISADRTLIATAGVETDVWNAKDGSRVISRRPPILDLADAMAFSPVDHTLAIVTGGSLCVWDIDRNQERQLLRRSVRTAAFSPDGKQIAAGQDNEVVLVDVATSQPVSEVRYIDGAISVAYSPKGDVIAIGESDGDVVLWYPDSGRVRRITVPGGQGYVRLAPFAALVLWGLAAWYISARRNNSFLLRKRRVGQANQDFGGTSVAD